MKIKKFLIQFVIVFAVTFVANAIVVYVWNLVQHGEGTFNWGLSFTLAVILGIVLPIIRTMTSKEK
jgi:uncharacterized membrane protein YagU involved in acid resistance